MNETFIFWVRLGMAFGLGAIVGIVLGARARDARYTETLGMRFLLLDCIRRHGKISGRWLLEIVRGLGYRLSAPAFYELMAKLEDELKVNGWYEHIPIAGRMLAERHYELTPAGEYWLNQGTAYQGYGKPHETYVG